MNGSFKWGRAMSIARKEARHILRDPYTLAMALGLPLLLVAFFGFAIDFNVKDLHLTVVDRDMSEPSRQLVEVFQSSGYFQIRRDTGPGDPAEILDSEQAKAVLIIEPRFARDVASGKGAQAQVLVDGADNSTVGVIMGYLSGIQQSAAKRFLAREGVTLPAPPARLKTRFLFNPELNTQWFIVPGLSVVVLAILSILLTALTVAREWENGSMELLLSTPVKPMEIIVGKLGPYVVMGLGIQGLIYLMARLVFHVPFQGSHLLFLLGSLLFISACLAQGLLISVGTRQQQLAIQLGIVSGMLPSFLLSGFIFPIESMSVFFQWFTAILPARWFMDIIRSVFLRGPGLQDMAVPFLALLLLNAILITLATKKFKKDMEP